MLFRSTFSIDLQAAREPAVDRSDAAARPAAGRTVGRVLAIDDDRANRQLLFRVLERELECSAISAGTGADGLQLAQDESPDLILLDLHLPDMHGEKVLEALQRNPGTSRIPVLVISGEVTQAAREETLRRGATAFFSKPYSIAELIDRIRSLDRKSTR